MRRVLVKVTRQDIRRGRSGDCYACPIVFAIMRALETRAVEVSVPWHLDPEVAWTHACWQRRDDTWTKFVPLPRSADRFVQRFDRKGGKRAVKPFRFFLVSDDA